MGACCSCSTFVDFSHLGMTLKTANLKHMMARAQKTPSVARAAAAAVQTRPMAQKPWMPNVTLDTDIVHGGVNPDDKTGAILTPMYLSTTFVQDSVDEYLAKGFSYSRTNNPTVTVLEEKVAKIENGFGSIV